MAIFTPTDRPKSVRNRCVIEVSGGVFCVVTLLFGFFCRCRGFCHRTESDLSFSLINHASFQIQVTALLLLLFSSILHPL